MDSIFGLPHHVVSQVVETEFVVGRVENVTGVGFGFGADSELGSNHGCEFGRGIFAFAGCVTFEIVFVEYEGLVVLLQAAYGESHELVYGAHPLGVTFGEVVVDGDDVHGFSVKCVEVGG